MEFKLRDDVIDFLRRYLADHNSHDADGVEHETYKEARELFERLNA